MKKCLVLAYGNPLRTDDGLAVAALERLQKRFDGETAIEFHSAMQPLPEHAALCSEQQFVLFLDASASLQPGNISSHRIVPANDSQPNQNTHSLDFQGLLNLTHRVYEKSPEAVCLAMGGHDFAIGKGLSPETTANLEEMVAVATRILNAQ
ncbi:MAG: hydrogenase maturation protease [bacterium]|nr:hydrogenase maturation protease [bacterium]